MTFAVPLLSLLGRRARISSHADTAHNACRCLSTCLSVRRPSMSPRIHHAAIRPSPSRGQIGGQTTAALLYGGQRQAHTASKSSMKRERKAREKEERKLKRQSASRARARTRRRALAEAEQVLRTIEEMTDGPAGIDSRDSDATREDDPDRPVFKRTSILKVRDYIAKNRRNREDKEQSGTRERRLEQQQSGATRETEEQSTSEVPSSASNSSSSSVHAPSTPAEDPLSPPATAQETWSVGSLFGRLVGAAKKRLPLTSIPAETEEQAQKREEQRAAEAKRLAEAEAILALSKAERLESQARLISQAIQRARAGKAGADLNGEGAGESVAGRSPSADGDLMRFRLDLGPDPANWARNPPPVKDRWLETLSFGLSKSIIVEKDGERAYDEEFMQSLVDDYDLEDHERLELLGDSIVNMSARLLAYLTYPDVNEGTLTRLGNYPAQNNILGILFRETGLAQRRAELRAELRGEQGFRDSLGNHARANAATAVTQPRAEAELSSEEDTQSTSDSSATGPDTPAGITRGIVKKDADIFEAYVAAVFLSHNCDFAIVHAWLSELFRPFLDHAFRFMVEQSEAIARLNAANAAAGVSSWSDAVDAQLPWAKKLKTLARSNKQLGFNNVVSANNIDPVLVTGKMARLAHRARKTRLQSQEGNGNSGNDGGEEMHRASIPPSATDALITVAARARRLREEALAEEARLRDQEELMRMGFFQRGFLNLRQGFNRHVLGSDEAEETRREVAIARARSLYGRGEQGRRALQIALNEKDKKAVKARKRKAAAVSAAGATQRAADR